MVQITDSLAIPLTRIKFLFIPLLCLLHMSAIFWWTLPRQFGSTFVMELDKQSWETQLFKWFTSDENSQIYSVFRRYIDVTGSQQYWDFFAPQAPKFHQYLSVCKEVSKNPDEGKIICKAKPLFSNLDNDFASFKIFGSYRSRWYRLTETLNNRQDIELFRKFSSYYHNKGNNTFDQSYLVLHQFELYPQLMDLPKSGYRMDKVINLYN